jgi:hypothetical protein
MAFKLTYSDGHETDYDDNTKWEVEAGVLKMGHEAGKWTVLLSPSHWATIEMVPAKKDDNDEDRGKDDDRDKDEENDKDEKNDS